MFTDKVEPGISTRRTQNIKDLYGASWPFRRIARSAAEPLREGHFAQRPDQAGPADRRPTPPKRWTISANGCWRGRRHRRRLRSAGPTRRYVEAFAAKSPRGRITPFHFVDRGPFQLEEFVDCSYLPLARVVEDPTIIRENTRDFGPTCRPPRQGRRVQGTHPKGGQLLVRQGPRHVRQLEVLPLRALHALGPQAPAERGGAPAV